MKRQGDSSFPTDGQKAILNKLNSKSKTNRKRTNADNWNKPQQKHRLGIVSNKLLCVLGVGGGKGLKPVLRCSNLTIGSAVVHIHL